MNEKEKKSKTGKIVFTGGGTAGHLFPILAIIREMKKIKNGVDFKIFYLGPNDKFLPEFLEAEGVKIKTIMAGKLRRYFSLWNFLDFLKIPLGFFQSFFWLFFLAPDLIFSKGGYGSFPVVLAAKILSIPVFLHESDISPGLASKIEGRWALEIFTSFEKTEFFKKEKIICVGNPIRPEILEGSKEEAREIFHFQGQKPVVLIIGGSQGSQKINDLVLEIIEELLFNFEVIHQTGPKNYKSVNKEIEALLDEKLKRYYHCYQFLNEIQLKHALKAADIVVSRAGSGAIFEIAASQKPAILIPLLSSAQNHQLKNAYAFEKAGGGETMEEANLGPHFFLEKLKYLISRNDILEQMKENSERFSRPKAAKIIAFYLAEYLNQSLKND